MWQGLPFLGRMMTLKHIAIVVDDYDKAVAWFRRCLKFELVEDTPVGGKRWVTMRPSGGGCSLVLGQARDQRQTDAIGNQFGGRVGFFLQTDSFAEDEGRLRENGVAIIREPVDQAYGRVLVFEDPWGNWWDLISASALPPS